MTSPLKAPSPNDLTSRQLEVLHWLAEGKTNWEIGQIIGCATETAKKHRRHIYATLGVANAIGAAEVYWRCKK